MRMRNSNYLSSNYVQTSSTTSRLSNQLHRLKYCCMVGIFIAFIRHLSNGFTYSIAVIKVHSSPHCHISLKYFRPLCLQLVRKLPSITVGHMLELVYSTNVHGISLKTLYRNFEDYDCTALLIVRDENDRVIVVFILKVLRTSL